MGEGERERERWTDRQTEGRIKLGEKKRFTMLVTLLLQSTMSSKLWVNMKPKEGENINDDPSFHLASNVQPWIGWCFFGDWGVQV